MTQNKAEQNIHAQVTGLSSSDATDFLTSDPVPHTVPWNAGCQRSTDMDKPQHRSWPHSPLARGSTSSPGPS